MRLTKEAAMADREQLRLTVGELKSKLDDADMREQKLVIANKNMMVALRSAEDEIAELKFKAKAAKLILNGWGQE